MPVFKGNREHGKRRLNFHLVWIFFNKKLSRQLQVTQVTWLVWITSGGESASHLRKPGYVYFILGLHRGGAITLVLYLVYLTGEFPSTLWAGFAGCVDRSIFLFTSLGTAPKQINETHFIYYFIIHLSNSIFHVVFVLQWLINISCSALQKKVDTFLYLMHLSG